MSQGHEQSLKKGYSQLLAHVSGTLFLTTFKTSLNFQHLNMPLGPITLKWHTVIKFVVNFNRLVLCKVHLDKYLGGVRGVI